MFLASLIFGVLALVSNQTQSIIESSAVIATSITALVLALRGSTKKRPTRPTKTKRKSDSANRSMRGEEIDSQDV